MAAGGSQVSATLERSVVGEVRIRRYLIPETPVNGCGNAGKLVLHLLRDVEPVQFVDEAVLTDHGRACRCRISDVLRHSAGLLAAAHK